MWSVAPVSMIQSLDLNAFLSTRWVEKIEWDIFGGIQKGLPEKLSAKLLDEGLSLGAAITVAAWWADGTPEPEAELSLRTDRYDSSCSHWDCEIGHWKACGDGAMNCGEKFCGVKFYGTKFCGEKLIAFDCTP